MSLAPSSAVDGLFSAIYVRVNFRSSSAQACGGRSLVPRIFGTEAAPAPSTKLRQDIVKRLTGPFATSGSFCRGASSSGRPCPSLNLFSTRTRNRDLEAHYISANEVMRMRIDLRRYISRAALTALVALTVVTGCAVGAGGRAVVKGTGPDELLKLRAGPSLGYRVILGLPDGTVLKRRDCVTELGQLWCRVSLADAPGVTGYVSADYISIP